MLPFVFALATGPGLRALGGLGVRNVGFAGVRLSGLYEFLLGLSLADELFQVLLKDFSLPGDGGLQWDQ